MAKSINYQRGKIYKIYYKKNPKKFFIGATTQQYICKRFHQHITYSQFLKKHKKRLEDSKQKLYDFVEKHGGWKKFKCKLLQMIPCKSKEELTFKEFECIQKEQPTLNVL